MGTGAFWRELGDGSNIFLTIYFQKTFFHHLIQVISFFMLAWKHEEGSDYLFHSLFSDLIF